MGAHEFGYPFAPHEPAGDQDPGVQLVEVGARRAHDVATVFAGHSQQALTHFASREIYRLPAESDRMRAVAGLLHFAKKVCAFLQRS